LSHEKRVIRVRIHALALRFFRIARIQQRAGLVGSRRADARRPSVAQPDCGNTLMPRFVSFALLCSVLSCGVLCAGCIARGDPTQPIPTETIAAKQPATRLVVVLPGRADNLRRLRDSGMAEAIQSVWADADVTYAEVTLDYYRQGNAPQRLHDEVIAPARARYRSVWLAGASLGGMGTLLYDAHYPKDVDGMVLLAPYVGDRPLLTEIDLAGGIAHWNPGPQRAFTADSWQRELWRHVQALSHDRQRTAQVWLAYGNEDRLREAMPLLTPALHADHVFVREGGHAWRVWTPAMREILQAIEASRGSTASGKTSDNRSSTRAP
jgi:pimeloyl-ACP methyl ester carboxylesterase